MDYSQRDRHRHEQQLRSRPTVMDYLNRHRLYERRLSHSRPRRLNPLQQAVLRRKQLLRARDKAIDRAERTSFCEESASSHDGSGVMDYLEDAKLHLRPLAQSRLRQLSQISWSQNSTNVTGLSSSDPLRITPALSTKVAQLPSQPLQSAKQLCSIFRHQMAKSVHPPKPPFPLLSLPRSVRNRVYTFALAGTHAGQNLSKHTITIRRDYFVNPDCTRALVVTNKQVHGEALPVLHGERIFVFREVQCVGPWLNLRSALARGYVQHIQLELGIDITGFTSLALAPLRRACVPELSPVRQLRQTCAYLAKHLVLKTLAIAFTGLAGMTCEGFHATEWAKCLCQVRGLERLDVFTERGGGNVEEGAVAVMKGRMEKGGLNEDEEDEEGLGALGGPVEGDGANSEEYWALNAALMIRSGGG